MMNPLEIVRELGSNNSLGKKLRRTYQVSSNKKIHFYISDNKTIAETFVGIKFNSITIGDIIKGRIEGDTYKMMLFKKIDFYRKKNVYKFYLFEGFFKGIDIEKIDFTIVCGKTARLVLFEKNNHKIKKLPD